MSNKVLVLRGLYDKRLLYEGFDFTKNKCTKMIIYNCDKNTFRLIKFKTIK